MTNFPQTVSLDLSGYWFSLDWLSLSLLETPSPAELVGADASCACESEMEELVRQYWPGRGILSDGVSTEVQAPSVDGVHASYRNSIRVALLYLKGIDSQLRRTLTG